MKRPVLNKRNLVRAITTMVKLYENDTIQHGLEICKLCRLYYNGNPDSNSDENNDNDGCEKCLNSCFRVADVIFKIPCVYRCINYPNLDYMNKWNNPTLAKFWQEVLVLVKANNENTILSLTDDFKAEFLKIADNYKDKKIML